MLWAYASASGLGLLLGLRYRAPAVIAGSVVLTLLGAPVCRLAGWSTWTAVAAAFSSVLALQCGYLAGLLLTCVASRILSVSPVAPQISELGR